VAVHDDDLPDILRVLPRRGFWNFALPPFEVLAEQNSLAPAEGSGSVCEQMHDKLQFVFGKSDKLKLASRRNGPLHSSK
jgi:hypothetical protein